jgi:hypothetical protein
VDVLNDAMRRGGPLLLVLALSAPAHALDCSRVPPLVVGQPLTEDQARCLSATVITDTLRAETCEAQLVASRIAVEACEATAAITCPPPEVPVVPFLAGVATGVVLAIVGAVLLLAGTR